MYRLEGKVALVTGAGRGIGRAISLRLAEEGADLAAIDLGAADAEAVAAEARRLGRRAVGIACDVTRAADVESAVASVVAQLGAIHVLVNNAGINVIAPLLETTEEQWDALFDVNVKSYWLCSKAVAPLMIAQGGGKIIMAASRAGKTPSRLVPIGGYSTTKHAVVGLTRALAFELAKHKINVNAYCPGVVDTPMWDLIDREVARRTGAEPGSVKARAVADIPLGRIQTPEDVANLVAWLASSESDYVTGQAINIEGGTEVH